MVSKRSTYARRSMANVPSYCMEGPAMVTAVIKRNELAQGHKKSLSKGEALRYREKILSL